MTPLSQHFSLEALIASDTAARLGFDNTPDDDQILKLTFLASQLELVRQVAGPLHVNSGYRCLDLNIAIGSKPSSQHLKCEAADLTSMNGMRPARLCRLIEESDIPFDQLILEFNSWMHISFVQYSEPRGSVLTIDKHGTQLGIVEREAE